MNGVVEIYFPSSGVGQIRCSSNGRIFEFKEADFTSSSNLSVGTPVTFTANGDRAIHVQLQSTTKPRSHAGPRTDSGDSDDRINHLEQELHELRHQAHGKLMPEPGIKGFLLFVAITNVAGSFIVGLAALGSLLVGAPSAVFFVPFFAYTLYVTAIFFQHKKSTPTHFKVIFVLSCLADILQIGAALSSREPNLAGVGIGRLIASSMWLAYWCVSKRVKVTFVK